MTLPFDLSAAPPVVPSASEEKAPAEPPEHLPDELKMLKQRADIMGIPYSNNIGVETLKGKIKDAMEAGARSTKVDQGPQRAHDDEPATDEEVRQQLPRSAAPMTKAELRQHQKKEYMRLIRLKIVNMNPSKANLKGEILTVANSVLGTVSKFIPYGDECGEDGYHVPYVLYLAMKERKFSQIKTDKRNRPSASDVSEFALEVLPPLTKKQLHSLALKQAAAKGATEAQSED